MQEKRINKLYQEMGTYIFTEETLLETEAIEGAIQSIKEIAKQYDIYIITARTQPLILHVKKWLQKYDIKKNITKVLSSSWEEKQDICYQNDIHFLCDDDKRHLEKEKIETRILFHQSKISNYSGIQEVNSWKEIEKLLLGD